MQSFLLVAPPPPPLPPIIQACVSPLPAGDNSSITREKLETILDAARWAPTHKLTEPWHFVVIGGSQKDVFEVGLQRFGVFQFDVPAATTH
jgi:hypothetical protein